MTRDAAPTPDAMPPPAPQQNQDFEQNVVPLKEKLAVGAGGLPAFMGNVAVQSTAQPFYVMMLNVSPALLGAVIAIPRFWDALTDPIMGRISDRWHSRHGRRRPFIFLGAILMAICFGLIWMPSPQWSESVLLGWFLATSLLFFTCYTIFAVPFTSLTFEMTPNYNERTTIMGYTTFASKVGEFCYQWFVPIATLSIFASPVLGMRIVLWTVAILMLGICGVIPAIFAKERYYKVQQKELKTHKSAGFWKAAGQTLRNRAFVVLISITLLQIVAGIFGSSLDYYLLVYYMFDGDIAQGSIWKGMLSTGYAVCGFVGIPVIIWFAKRTSKLTALQVTYVLTILNGLIRWFVYTPGNQMWIMIDPIFGSLYWIAVGTVKQSMMADVCDDDELKHGERREGMYGAVFGWITKTAISLSAFVSGIALVMVGFDSKLGGGQAESTFLGMRLLMVLGTMIPNLIALGILQFYPLTKEKAYATRRILEARRGKVG
jgi:GPH family glycoside/pentoside/hexuronide:cation symporter